MCEVGSLDTFLVHPDVTGIHRQVEARGAGTEHHHPAALDDEGGDRERRFARMFEHQIDVIALAGNIPDGLAETAGFGEPGLVFLRIHRGAIVPSN